MGAYLGETQACCHDDCFCAHAQDTACGPKAEVCMLIGSVSFCLSFAPSFPPPLLPFPSFSCACHLYSLSSPPSFRT